MKAAFHYVVRKRLIVINENGAPETIEDEKVFKNESPIIAREEAFDHLQNYVEVLLEGLGKDYTSDKQARKDLKHFTQYEFTDSNTYHSDTPKFIGGIGIFLIQDKKPSLTQLDIQDGYNNIIYSIGRLGEIGFAMEDEHDNYLFVESLDAEYKLYQCFNYDTKNHKRVIEYFGPPLDYGIGDYKLLKYEVLETPFDWTEYGKIMEERRQIQDEDVEEEVETLDKRELSEEFIRNLIDGGESESVEFKPSLYYDFKLQGPSIRIKAICAKAICAFLNTRGGFLLIGVNDKKEIIGLENDYKLFPEGKRSRSQSDRFRLEFENLINQFFDKSVRSRLDTGNVAVNGKEIFFVEVYASKNPVFLKGEKGKEFYTRGAASSQPLIDVEDIVKYCMNKWGS